MKRRDFLAALAAVTGLGVVLKPGPEQQVYKHELREQDLIDFLNRHQKPDELYLAT